MTICRPYPADMNEAGAAGVLAGLAVAIGFVLAILGTVLWLIDRRFDEPPEQSAGRKLLRVGLMVMLVGALALVAIALAT